METSLDKASEKASGVALDDDADSFFIAADYHHRLQLPDCEPLVSTRANGFCLVHSLH
jgi:hypothetical protein